MSDYVAQPTREEKRHFAEARHSEQEALECATCQRVERWIEAVRVGRKSRGPLTIVGSGNGPTGIH